MAVLSSLAKIYSIGSRPGKVCFNWRSIHMYFPRVTGRVEISVKFETIENNSLLDSINTQEGRDAIQKDPARLER